MGHTAVVLGDQLLRDHPALDGADRVLFVESLPMLRRRWLHRQRAHVVLSGMRHFAEELRAGGDVEVVERRAAPSLAAALADERGPLVAASPNAPGARAVLERAGARLVPSTQFLTPSEDFAAWADGRRRLKMEDFYREQRRRFGVLLDADGGPEGGQWNYDPENRRPPRDMPADLRPPEPWRPTEDDIDAEVRRDLDTHAPDLWGRDAPRRFAVTPEEADRALRSFIDERLPEFGPWQDAMVPGEPWLFHSLLSVPLNLGVLDPLDAVRAAEAAYRSGGIPLQSAEGFIRQILGWREYVHGVFWLRQLDGANALDAHAPLPDAFLGEPSGWNCLDSVVDGVRERGYAHHIERLMVLGNTLLLTGVEPGQAVDWFARAFVDGAAWVMAPNAAGMALYADGGQMTTKPYAAGGNYVNRMSRFCGDCRYDPKQRTGPDACPLSALYWDFVDRHRERLDGNRRMAMPLRSLAKIDPAELDAIRARAADARAELGVSSPASSP